MTISHADRVRRDLDATTERTEATRATEEMITGERIEEKEERIEEKIDSQEREERIPEENQDLKGERRTGENVESTGVREQITDTEIIDNRTWIEGKELPEDKTTTVTTTEDRAATTTETIELSTTAVSKETPSTDLVKTMPRSGSSSVVRGNLSTGARSPRFCLEMTH